ncbi:unnamed protein product [Rotaria sordida]|uniref:Uncharacterized protein n=1 Tax=Rotaria sordida TaxID=392033 RepID=A0A819PGV0_9BILA|nr:unnamed protein product [Rotaria sordida]
MNPSKDLHSSSYLVRETFIVPKDDQDINLVPERKNVQQKRNAEYLIQVLYKLKFSEEECISRFSASFENQVDSSSQQRNSESLWKTWKYRLALARTTQERSDALKFLSSYKDKSNSCHHLPTFNELQTEHDNHDSKDARSVSQLQVDKIESDPTLSNTGITDRGVRLLADLLCDVDADTDSCCSSLEKLYLSFNTSITDESMEALLQIIEQNRTLKLLSVQYCSLSDQARQLLRETG